MPSAGHGTTIKASGAANAVVNEATTSLGGSVYQVTNTARRIWDPSAAITIKDGGVAVGAEFWSFDYLFGKVTFSGYAPGGAVTVDGSYLGTFSVTECRRHSIALSRDLQDATTYDSGGWRKRQPALLDVSGDLECLSRPTDDLDAGVGGTQSLYSFLTNGTPKLLEIGYGARLMRGWVLLEALDEASEVEGLNSFTLNFQGSSQRGGASFAMD